MKKIWFILGILPLSMIGFGQIPSESIRIYYDSIEKNRTGKNIRLMYSESTPLTPEQQRSFKGLDYFPPDIHFLIEATVHKNPEEEIVLMTTTTGRKPEYIKYGEVRFSIDTLEYSLAAYQSKKLLDVKQDENHLFIPFRDGTSGKESYEGGRYIDCIINLEGQKTLLDFNKAYNPYCAYNPSYSCVIPPEENNLPVRIEAGEKKFR
jgi:uncharacterized protein